MSDVYLTNCLEICHGHDRLIVGFTTTHAISVYLARKVNGHVCVLCLGINFASFSKVF